MESGKRVRAIQEGGVGAKTGAALTMRVCEGGRKKKTTANREAKAKYIKMAVSKVTGRGMAAACQTILGFCLE